MSALRAVQHIRRMRGGSQAHLLRASDENYYVTKFQHNPQHTRVLANEMFASRIGLWLGLPMAPVEVIEVPESMIERTPELVFEFAGASIKCQPGRQLGSRYVADPFANLIFDYLPENLFDRVKNSADFARALVLDKWTANCDGRQAVFSKRARQRQYTVTFIDQGYCFNAAEWTFPDLALQGVHYRNHVYAEVRGWCAFEPALTKAEECDIIDIWRAAEGIPPEWYDADAAGLERLVEQIYQRRTKIRELIADFRDSSRNPFPNWSTSANLPLCSAHPVLSV
jgi:hypothetical protein